MDEARRDILFWFKLVELEPLTVTKILVLVAALLFSGCTLIPMGSSSGIAADRVAI